MECTCTCGPPGIYIPRGSVARTEVGKETMEPTKEIDRRKLTGDVHSVVYELLHLSIFNEKREDYPEPSLGKSG